MRRTFLYFSAVIALLPATVATAAQVEALQTPAWVERAGQRQPLRPGMTLAAADVIETGKGARLLLRFGDGSLLRVGADARLVIEKLTDAGTGVEPPGLAASVDVSRGAVHLTTGQSGRAARRELELRVGATRIAIDGTDLWARLRDGVATVCLVEGRIGVRHPVRGEFVMDQALTFFIAPATGEPHPVAPVEAGQLAKWSAETELQLGQGVLLPGGGWIVQLGSYERETDARRLERQLLDAGLPVEVTTVQLRDRSFYRLRISGFDARQDARVFADRTRPRPGMPDPWVTCEIPGRSCQ